MAKKNSLLHAKDIRVGKSYYIWVKRWGEQPKVVKVVIAANKLDGYFGALVTTCGKNLFISDLGVIGAQYDNRPTQMFNNRRSAQFWLDHYLAKKDLDPSKIGFNFFDRGIHN